MKRICGFFRQTHILRKADNSYILFYFFCYNNSSKTDMFHIFPILFITLNLCKLCTKHQLGNLLFMDTIKHIKWKRVILDYGFISSPQPVSFVCSALHVKDGSRRVQNILFKTYLAIITIMSIHSTRSIKNMSNNIYIAITTSSLKGM